LYVAVGVICSGCGTQVAGTVPVQLIFTGLAYPASAVSVPLNVAVCVGKAVCGELETTFV
jgi:hypothetical protein